MKMTFQVPAGYKVFVLDDTQDRLDWFGERLPGMRFAKTSAAAIEILSAENFDLVFLDHDLSFMDAADVSRQFGNGKEVARFLAIKKFAGKIVIHSKNEAGVKIMAKILPQATVARFDEFEIALTHSQSAGR